MKILIDIQGCQSDGSRFRGIGRYSRCLIKSLIANYPEHEYILFANKLLFNVSSDFSEYLYNDDYKVTYLNWIAPGPFTDRFNKNGSRYSIAVQIRSFMLSQLNVDIILITSFFEGFIDNSLVDLDFTQKLPPILTILYDLIPLLNRQTYLDTNPDFETYYLKKLKTLQEFDALLAISESAKKEVVENLNFSTDKVFNISSACDNYPFIDNITKQNNVSLDIDQLGSFILYVGAGDPRKNLYRLLQAYSRLSPSLIIKHKIVLAGQLLKEEIALIESLLFELGIPSQYLILLGYISDLELVKLYQKCYLFIFPSIHEGFGLPVLEAMTCGAAVIASNTSSVPEVIGLSEATFNPFDIDEITYLLRKALVDEQFYQKLKSNAKKRSPLFSWKFTSEITINAMHEIYIKHQKDSKSKNTENLNIFLERFKNSLEQNNKLVTNDIYMKEIAASIDLNCQAIKDFNFIDIEYQAISNWLIEGPFDSHYSLAIVNRNFALALNKLDINVCLNSSEGAGDFSPNMNFLKSYNDLKKIYMKGVNHKNKFLVSSRNLYPPRVNDMISNLKLLHAYGWEESQIPEKWVNEFNSYLDGITVMSEFVKKTLIDNGVYIPVDVCGLGVDHLDSVPYKEFNLLSAKKFRFLHVSSCFPRKGIDVLLKAFGQEFSIDDDVSLIIKTFNNQHNNVNSLLIQYQNKFPKYPHVIIIEDEFDDAELKALYKFSDVLIAPSYGEGFGLPIAEAMYLGIPVITTNFSGQKDFCSHDNSWLIDFKFEYSKSHFNLLNSVWAIPLTKDLALKMRDSYYLPKDIIELKVNNARRDIESFLWHNVAKINIQHVNRILSRKPNKCVHVGWVSTWNSRCGISSYSSNLLNDFDENVTIFSPLDESLIDKDNLNVKRCWKLSKANLDDLYLQICNSNITTLIIQFNFGFFDYQEFTNLLQKVSNQKIKILIFMHSTIPPKAKSNPEQLFLGLRKCNRVFVHTPNDLNRLKDFGIIHNATLFPHGVPFYRPKTKNNLKSFIKSFSPFNNQKIILATFGFCLPDKGFLELIYVIDALRKFGFNVFLKMYISLHESELSVHTMSSIKELVLQLNLSQFIFINSDFLDQKDILDTLSSCDAIVFPYQRSNESTSAAIRLGLVSGSNVFATPLNVFSDVSDCIQTFSEVTVDSMVKGLSEWIVKSNGKSFDSHSEAKHSWLDQHQFYNLSQRLIGIIKALEMNS